MIADERRNKICELLKLQSAVTTVSLAERFGVSIETIRKDLLMLEREHKLTRAHGGAVLPAAARPYTKLSKRMEDKLEEKYEISRIATKFIKNGDIIALDTGSTAVEFIEVLMERFDELTIVTHSMDVFKAACNYKNFNIILCGGFFLKNENSFYGDFVYSMMENIHVSKVFIFPAALSLKNGICDSYQELGGVQKKMFGMGDEIFIVADSSKYEKSALIKVSAMNDCYTYISDSKLPEEVKEIYINNNIKIVTD